MTSALDLWSNTDGLDPGFLAFLENRMQPRSVRKGEVLQVQGERAQFVFFVKKGLLRSFATDAQGRAHTFMFAPEGWVVSDAEVQLGKSTAALTIEALEDSELEVVDIARFRDVPGRDAHFDREAIEKLSSRLAVLQKRIIMLMAASALERFHDFMETYPDILQRVPQKMVASYLGITPEALSKIKGQMLRKG